MYSYKNPFYYISSVPVSVLVCLSISKVYSITPVLGTPKSVISSVSKTSSYLLAVKNPFPELPSNVKVQVGEEKAQLTYSSFFDPLATMVLNKQTGLGVISKAASPVLKSI